MREGFALLALLSLSHEMSDLANSRQFQIHTKSCSQQIKRMSWSPYDRGKQNTVFVRWQPESFRVVNRIRGDFAEQALTFI